jgi:hypothetical protein
VKKATNRPFAVGDRVVIKGAIKLEATILSLEISSIGLKAARVALPGGVVRLFHTSDLKRVK